jgi:hypothetical protein
LLRRESRVQKFQHIGNEDTGAFEDQSSPAHTCISRKMPSNFNSSHECSPWGRRIRCVV